MAEFRTTETETVADVGFTRLDQVTIEAPDGSTATRYVLRLPNAVAVVPIVGEEVVLIEQHRAPHEGAVLEIPAGMLDVDGEDPEDAARRELEEEIGFTANELTHLADILTSPGVTDEVIRIYSATGLEPVDRRPTGLEERHARIVKMPITEAVEQVRTGAIRDAKSAVGLLLVAP